MLSSRHAHALVWGLLHSCVRVGESRRVVDVDLELACLPACLSKFEAAASTRNAKRAVSSCCHGLGPAQTLKPGHA